MSALSAAHRELVREAMLRAGFGSQANMLAAVDDGDSALPARTRQARHAQLARARSSAAASCLVLASSDREIRTFLLSREGSWLRPLTSEVLSKVLSVPTALFRASLRGSGLLFSEAAELLCSLVPELPLSDDLGALRAHSAFACMSMGAFVHGRSLRGAWCDARAELRDCGALDNPHLRLRAASLGSWLGEAEDHAHVLFDPNMRPHRLNDAYYFVRNDCPSVLYALGARIVRGAAVEPLDCLAGGRPASTLRQGLDCIIACLRDPHHLTTATKTLNLLTLMDDSLAFIEDMRRRGTLAVNATDLLLRLHTLERVQRMDKGRFWQLCDQLEDGPLKQRITELWSQDYPRAGLRALAHSAE